ncbi:MAG: flagellar motor switch protein FliN [Treponema sp.]
MSDGSISQNEIDALLSGVDMGGGLGSSSSGSEKFPQKQQDALQKFFDGTVPALVSNLESMTNTSVTVGNPTIEIIDRESFLKKVSDMVVTTIIDFDAGLSGDHLFVYVPEFAEKLVGLVNNEENVSIDDMALSVVSETISQYVGKEINALDSENIKGVTNMPAVSHHVPKAMVRLSQDFALITYKIKLNDAEFELWEVVAKKIATEIGEKLGGIDPVQQMAAQGIPVQSAPEQGGTMAMPNMAMNMGGTPQMQPQMTMGMPMQGMGAMPSGGMVMPGMNPNVQSIQFPPLQNGVTGTEQGNIGLIMDVYMEMTVELGRTRKMIKEILSMGEGHIIELDKLAGEPVDILVNHKPIAKGEVVVIDENFGVRVTEILSPAERIADA